MAVSVAIVLLVGCSDNEGTSNGEPAAETEAAPDTQAVTETDEGEEASAPSPSADASEPDEPEADLPWYSAQEIAQALTNNGIASNCQELNRLPEGPSGSRWECESASGGYIEIVAYDSEPLVFAEYFQVACDIAAGISGQDPPADSQMDDMARIVGANWVVRGFGPEQFTMTYEGVEATTFSEWPSARYGDTASALGVAAQPANC